eukprot:COSAG02_NODE_2604_length_8443_cov_6.439593_1_plen_132_part_00
MLCGRARGSQLTDEFFVTIERERLRGTIGRAMWRPVDQQRVARVHYRPRGTGTQVLCTPLAVVGARAAADRSSTRRQHANWAGPTHVERRQARLHCKSSGCRAAGQAGLLNSGKLLDTVISTVRVLAASCV